MPVTTTTIEHRSRGVVRSDIVLTTTAGGAVPATVVGVGFGRLVGVLYDGGLDASAVITITDTKTGATLVAYTTGAEGTPVFFRPTQVITSDAGADIAASANAVGVNRDIYVGGKVSVTVASGGVSETGRLALIVDEANLYDPPLTV